MYTIKERIKYSQLDKYGQLSLRSLLDMYQDCATMHTEDVGYPMDWFIKNRRGWFVTSYQIKNHRLPRHGERVRIGTVPVKVKGFIGLRLFELRSESGELLSEAYSEWVYMDLTKLSPVRVPSEMIDAYETAVLPEGKWGSRKVKIIENKEDAGSFLVEGLYLDTNNHMNNAYYIVPAALTLDCEYSSIKIEFKTSAKYLDTVYIKKASDDERVVVSLESDEGNPFCVVEFSDAKR